MSTETTKDGLEDLQYLQVTNNTAIEIRGRFHGVDYRWKSGDALTLPIAAAVHIFGFGRDDKSAAFHRLGWSARTGTLEQAENLLSQISFEPVHQIYELESVRQAKKREAVTVDAAVDDGTI